ncbi:amidohydrolase family protein [Paenibacillus sp. EPM92]|uniref:N-acyl-D-amino-acid deacylase family protein n=1 Tax=Paenibacillus sp. EPM92 TaxID=1561195 RepID=UPI0019153DA1|nr:D-aminoacylase [Paenibacillus sp. EPM92]
MYDILIQGGLVVDGSGAPGYHADVAVKDGLIRSIGILKSVQAKRVIQADQLVVAPGFIDIHTHDDLHVLENPYMDVKIRQGVTTTVIGNCGFGLYPVLPETRHYFNKYAAGLFGAPEKGELGYSGLDDFFAEFQKVGSAINVASLVAHGVIRVAVMGYDNRKPTSAEMEKMKGLLRDALRSGAVGMSMGLIYAPGLFADTEELIELSKVVAEEGGFIASHMRNEASYLLESIEEMITIAREARVPLEISHLKAVGNSNFGKARKALHLIEKAKMEGIDITFDQYPYHAGSTTATTILPPWALEGGHGKMLERLRNEETRAKIKDNLINGIPNNAWESMSNLIGWENMMICTVESDKNKSLEGSSIKEIAEKRHIPPLDLFLDLLVEEEGRIILIMFQQDLDEMETVMQHELQMFGSDGIPQKGKKAHRRLYGTFPQVLGKYVREKNTLHLERAIYKMTYLPSNRLGLFDRGLIRPGMVADITLFNKNTIDDHSTYAEPAVNPSGIEAVLVNGEIVLENGIFTGIYPGKPLRRSLSNDRYKI